MAEGRLQRRLAAILSADIAGYSRLMGRDEAGTLARLKGLRNDIVDPVIAAHAGRTVKLMGDGWLVEFASAVDAVACAIELQKQVGARNAGIPAQDHIAFRIGINVGDIIVDGDDIYGDGVNVAARIQTLAEPGSVYIARGVADQVRGKVPAGIEPRGAHRVKNIAQPIEVFRVAAGQRAFDTPVRAPVAGDKPSIAVLAFDNMSGDPAQDYFSDGISDDIITSLSKLPELHVIARNSSFTYKGKPADVKQIGRELGVRCVLEGSVRKAGNRVRVSGQLIDAATGTHLWAERYDRELADIFAVQDDITAQIVGALKVKLIDANRAPASRAETDNPEAYDCVLRGREQYRLFTKENHAAARRLYERAIALDPNYAEAYAGLAETALHEWLLGVADGLDRAFAWAQTAKRLDPSLPLVYEALGSVHLFRREHDEALAAATRWVELEPNDPEAYVAMASVSHFGGRPERVRDLIETAKRLNPFYPFYYNLYIGQGYFAMRRFAEAAPFLERSVARNPQSLPSQAYLAACYGQLGDEARARDTVTAARQLSPDFSLNWAQTVTPYRRAADRDNLIEGLRKAGLTA